MAATYSKPTKVARWATTTGNKAEPSEAEKDAGWVFESTAKSSYANWNQEINSTWFQWLGERFFDGAVVGGDKEDFYIMKPGETLDTILAYSADDDVIYCETTFLAGLTDVDIGDATDDFRNIYTKNLFVENYPLSNHILAVTIALVYDTSITISPNTSDTELLADGITVNSSRELVLDSGMPTGIYKLEYNARLDNASAEAGINFTVWKDTGGGAAEITDTLIYAQNSSDSQTYPTCSWLISVAPADKIQVRAKQTNNVNASEVMLGSNLTMQLVKPTYV